MQFHGLWGVWSTSYSDRFDQRISTIILLHMFSKFLLTLVQCLKCAFSPLPCEQHVSYPRFETFFSFCFVGQSWSCWKSWSQRKTRNNESIFIFAIAHSYTITFLIYQQLRDWGYSCWCGASGKSWRFSRRYNRCNKCFTIYHINPLCCKRQLIAFRSYIIC